MKIKNLLSLLSVPLALLFASALAFGQGSPGPSNYPISQQVQAGAPSGNCPGTNVYSLNTSTGSVYSCPVPGGPWVSVAGGGSSNFNLTNSTPATSSTPQSSPTLGWNGTWWGPSLASATDGWTLLDVPSTSTTMAAGLTATASETSGVVTISGSGMPVFPVLTAAGFTGTNQGSAPVIFKGFTTLTWLNGVVVNLITNTSSSITFLDQTNHANQGSTPETAVTASSAQSVLTLQQLAGSAPLGVFQLSNATAATADSMLTSPTLQFQTNRWNGSSSVPEDWNIYIKGISTGNAAASLVLSYTGQTANTGAVLSVGQGSSNQNAPNLGFYNNNNGVLSTDGFIGVVPADGTTYNTAFSMQSTSNGQAMALGGAAGSTAGADVDIGSQNNNTRNNTTGPNEGVVLSGLYLAGSPGFGGETFAPASGSSKNFAVWSGGKFNPAAGSTTFVGLNVTPIIQGTTSGNTTALSVDPQLTVTNLTGTNCQQTWHDGTATSTTPGVLVACMDYSGVLIPSVIYSAAGTAIPACNAARNGGRTVVSDATTPTFLGTYASGGAVKSPVMCNGTNWVTY
jgi:hypothetical protein